MSVTPFDIKTILLAKHTQHVVLTHFRSRCLLLVCIRPSHAMDEAAWFGGRGYPAAGCDFDGARTRLTQGIAAAPGTETARTEAMQ
jgi:hypothetical protein